MPIRRSQENRTSDCSQAADACGAYRRTPLGLLLLPQCVGVCVMIISPPIDMSPLRGFGDAAHNRCSTIISPLTGFVDARVVNGQNYFTPTGFVECSNLISL